MIPENDKTYCWPYRLSLLVLLVLLILSFFTYRERMLFTDPAWVAFNIINTKSLLITEYRIGTFITQIFPLIGVYLGLSLKAILILYSISHYLFFLAIAILVGTVWKQKWLAILLALYLTVFVSDLYYWPNNEVHQGLGWMFLFLGLYLHRRNLGRFHAWHHLLLLAFAFLALSSHMLVMLPFGFLWA